MNVPQLATKFKFFILRFIQLQLFITLFSLPILIMWGLPFSLLSPLGNLIFSPLLTIFLFFSSLIFFTELCGIPNSWCIYCLDNIISWWLTCMHADSKTWLIGFAKPSVVFLSCVTILTISIMLYKKTYGIYTSIACFLALFLGVSLYLHSLSTPRHFYNKLPCNRGEIHTLYLDKKLIIIDPGFIGQRLSAASWIQYTLIPYIIQLTGKTSIDHLILLQPGGLLFEAVERLCTKIEVKNIHIACWDGTMAPSSLRRYGKLMRTIQKQKTMVHRITKRSHPIIVAEHTILVESMGEPIIYQEINYPSLRVHAFIDNQDITLYSAKYTKKTSTFSHENNTKPYQVVTDDQQKSSFCGSGERISTH